MVWILYLFFLFLFEKIPARLSSMKIYIFLYIKQKIFRRRESVKCAFSSYIAERRAEHNDEKKTKDKCSQDTRCQRAFRLVMYST
jgi:hypothetical protein